MNFMEKFNELANRTLVPIANKLGNQRHLAAIRDGMVVAIPLSILGGVCLIISTPPFKPETLPNWGFITDMLNGWYNWAQANKAMLQLPYNMTMALMGLFIAFAIAYHLADEYEMPKLNSAIVSTSVFLIVSAPFIFRTFIIILSSTLRAVKDMKTPMMINVYMNIINIILNFFLTISPLLTWTPKVSLQQSWLL